ncbi:52 kDa repressor of the inhibitor of the protein kinase-like [Schistocerca cancellata]|uniref:52 kDa repressor of the inhibitor of the protein kinase-like n=1 Tax=Schistocerca cancellata TaxID=274614 RepID=UPI0021188388|nr:52 kDa repressor of the inhibitor of the protein kinase-like [Schistocerca cancellata]
MHMNSGWHKDAIEKSNNFISVVTNKTKSVEELANENLPKLVQTNRAKLKSIVSCVLFCALHDLPLREETNSNAVFDDLLQFRLQSGDETLWKRFEGAPKNATCVSHRTQNDLCAKVLRNDLINTINNTESFSVLADKSMDIAGTEQLSLSARYFDHVTNVVREDFLEFTPLATLDVKHISNTIISTLSAWGLNLDKMVGQGYDGCSMMAGKIGRVQKIIAEKYPKARFYRCASHRLNLVVNDLNTLPEVRRAIGTIKEGISFFQGSTQRIVLVGNLQKLCETRWSEKHKSIRKFNDKFLEIVEALAILHKEGDRETSQKVRQLYCTLTSPTFILTLKVIAKYSAKLEPVTSILQSVNINLLEVSEHIQGIVKMLLDDRENAEGKFEMIMKSTESNYSALGIDVTGIRQLKSLFIPYLDFLVQSLQEQFTEDNKASFAIFCLHPKVMKSQSNLDVKRIIENIIRFYGNLLDNLTEEAWTWISMWKRNKVTEGDIAQLSLTDLLDIAKFIPTVASALKIALSLLATTCSAERSFSTHRSVKMWLRPTMADNRLSCLCMVSVHHDNIKSEEESFIEKVVDSYGKDLR